MRSRTRRSGPWLVGAVLLAMLAGCGGSGSGGGGTPPTPGVGESDPAGAPNLAYRTRTVIGPVQTADAQGLTVTTAGGRRQVAYVPATVFRVVTPSQRSAVRAGACVDVEPGSPRGIPTHRTFAADDVVILPAASCRLATASPAPGTVSPDIGSGYSALLAPLGAHTGVVRRTDATSLLIATAAGGATMRVLTNRSTSYLELHAADASAVRAGQCAEVFAQLPSTTLQALTVTMTPSCSSHPGYGSPP